MKLFTNQIVGLVAENRSFEIEDDGKKSLMYQLTIDFMGGSVTVYSQKAFDNLPIGSEGSFSFALKQDIKNGKNICKISGIESFNLKK